MEDENVILTEGDIGVTGENTPAEVLRYEFWKQVGNTAIYISESGGVAAISHCGLYFPKPRLCSCPAMRAKSRPSYFLFNVSYKLGKKCVNNHFYLHRAVAEVYLHPKNLFEIEVDHLDGNINNYHRLNLEWVTHEENIRRAVEARRKKRKDARGGNISGCANAPQKGGVSQ